MSEKNIIITIKNLATAYISRFKDVTTLAGLEAKLARKTFTQLIFMFVMFALFAISTWFSLLLLACLLIVSYGFTWLAAVGSVVGLNCIILITLYLMIQSMKENLTFPATRRQIRDFNKVARG